ncbi:MAG: DUF4132 domain-containing protein [Bacteroidota bacterium]
MEKTLTFLNSDYLVNEQWLDLFTHFILLDRHNKMPLRSWYPETKELIHKIGEEEFIATGSKWISDCIAKSKKGSKQYAYLRVVAAYESIQQDLGFKDKQIPEWVIKVYGENSINGGFFVTNAYLNSFQYYFYQSLGGRILRGFLHSAVIINDSRLIELVDRLALASPNSSQDAIHIYSLLPEALSIPRLTNLKSRARNKNILKRIDKAITKVGKKAGKTKAEIEESVIPDFGISNDSTYTFRIEDIACVSDIHNHKKQLTYYEWSDGKRQRTLPQILKDSFPNHIKRFKKKVKEIKVSISSQKKRIEEFFLFNRMIPFASFKEHYLEHNLIKIIARDLIWNFRKDSLNINLMPSAGGFIDAEGNAYTGDLAGTTVSLWHPIGFERDYILKWRNYMLENQVLQPFKQAFREIYIITDAELNTATYSNRYASHILSKDHVYALCKARGWSPSGIIDGGKVAYNIPESDYKVEYWAGDIYLGGYSKMYGSAHVATDQVRFYKKKEQLPLSEVPAIIFSEVMRDVDLFVGVTSIGNNPEWQDRGDDRAMNYWVSYSSSELTEQSKTRAEILKNIIPKMKIAEQCEFQGKYLRVKGTLRNYKIHIGSGNILMEPNNQYLCIVANRFTKSRKKIFIPFEGDLMLSVIISKALLLAEDSKITDRTILSQIKRK